MHRITESTLEDTALAAIRDALLPKRISGEIMMTDAKKITGAEL